MNNKLVIDSPHGVERGYGLGHLSRSQTGPMASNYAMTISQTQSMKNVNAVNYGRAE